ncbi:MAG: lysyl oxidase family protein [Candidatus Moranbacteria bacterium]|jgi:hypothetical protein|nr:lysyl oxidase family protein [Candidatus Moranbacteria bacterium]MDD5652183.1 lysyl oxidase family protein [Candidatus Moranbacteria bacterium]MDX9855722.1 lysyl oxidase family protein [Candidatus Moranbacteria bacterium]
MKKTAYLASFIFLSAMLAAVLSIILSADKNSAKEEEKHSDLLIVETEESLFENEPEAEGAEKSELLLPDLQIEKLKDVYIEIGSDGKKFLRFPGTFANRGDGPLELEGTRAIDIQKVRAMQNIYKKDKTMEKRFVGDFVFHPDHNHWHFENFVEFGIYALKNDSEPDQKLAGTGKLTFCIHDYAPLPENLPGKPDKAVYPWCDNYADIQGISVGWADTYVAEIPGQEIDITGIPDGKYAFRASIDPENLIMEKVEDNNFSFSLIEISGNNARIISDPPL